MNDCPHCGCNGVELLGLRTTYHGITELVRCEHCGHEWRRIRSDEPDSPKPERKTLYRLVKVRCPECGAANPPVTSTQRPIRHHKCDQCGECFKSVEEKT